MNAPAGASGDERLSRPMAGRQLGRYEILTQLASGGMASVYIARAQGVAGFERLVAIKVLHPHLAYEQEFISMFLDEARLAARIRHMNVVPTLDISDSPGDGYFLVMEYVEGNHLGALLGRAAKRGERLPRPFVFRVLIDALQGLGAAHRLTDENGRPLKLVHRDVSPHNILVGTDGISRLTDFGVAKADVRMASTRAGQFKGKLSYMAPEQAASNETDQRSDLFSMGIILWESLTGRRLFKGESNGATLNRLLNGPIVKPSELWSDLEPYDEVVIRALERDPDRRFQTADELAEALDAVAGKAGVAKTRDVAEVVRALDAEKLEDERQRVRDAIELLGRSEIGSSNVPMPRDSTGRVSLPAIERCDGESQVRGAGTGRHARSAPDPSAPSSLLQWLLMLLAILLLSYAGFRAWPLVDPRPLDARVEQPAGVAPPPPGPAPSTAPKGAIPPTETRHGEAMRDGTAAEADDTAERTTSAPAGRSSRRTRLGPAGQVTSPSAPQRRKAPARETVPATHPIDIDIANPYRN